MLNFWGITSACHSNLMQRPSQWQVRAWQQVRTKHGSLVCKMRVACAAKNKVKDQCERYHLPDLSMIFNQRQLIIKRAMSCNVVLEVHGSAVFSSTWRKTL